MTTNTDTASFYAVTVRGVLHNVVHARTEREAIEGVTRHAGYASFAEAAKDWDAEFVNDYLSTHAVERLKDIDIRIYRAQKDRGLIFCLADEAPRRQGDDLVSILVVHALITDHGGPDGQQRDWYKVDGRKYGAQHELNGKFTLLNPDGKPLPDSDGLIYLLTRGTQTSADAVDALREIRNARARLAS